MFVHPTFAATRLASRQGRGARAHGGPVHQQRLHDGPSQVVSLTPRRVVHPNPTPPPHFYRRRYLRRARGAKCALAALARYSAIVRLGLQLPCPPTATPHALVQGPVPSFGHALILAATQSCQSARASNAKPSGRRLQTFYAPRDFVLRAKRRDTTGLRLRRRVSQSRQTWPADHQLARLRRPATPPAQGQSTHRKVTVAFALRSTRRVLAPRIHARLHSGDALADWQVLHSW